MAKKAENTSEDGLGPKVGELTDEQKLANDQIDISPFLTALMWKEPFFGTIYMRVSRLMDRKIVPTMGVAVIDDRPSLVWNQDFVSTLTDKQVLGVLKHEAYHLIYSHCVSRRHEPHMLWNWATDLSINTALEKDELPEGGLFPGSPLKKPEPDVWKKMKKEEQERFTKVSNLIAGMKPSLSAEEYFALLLDDPEIQKMMQEAEDAAKELIDAIGKALKDATSGDDHGKWGKSIDPGTGEETDLPDGVKQLLDGEMKQALQDAVNRADGGNSWGSVPSEMQRQLRALISTEVDWRAVLRQFIGMSRRANAKNSHKKINRKAPYAYPGRSKSYTANIAIYVDQSGSVDDHALELLYGELRSLSKKTTFHFFPFDTQVDVKNGFIWKKGQTRPNLERFRAGGTDFQACIDHCHANKNLFDGMLVLTDGQCYKPTACRKRLAYLLAPGCQLAFEPSNGEIVIKMKGKEVKSA
jgi:predicted metal-dependent peptidase